MYDIQLYLNVGPIHTTYKLSHYRLAYSFVRRRLFMATFFAGSRFYGDDTVVLFAFLRIRPMSYDAHILSK